MNISSILSPRRVLASLCLAFALLALATPVRADEPPKIADSSAAAFVKQMSTSMDDLLKAVQAKDEAKIKAANAKLEETGKAGDAVDSKFTPDEKEAVGKWMQDRMTQLLAAGWSPQ